ncbi:hypothetical protein BCR39DRAFT_463736 [Naematelia encephala]|uniref:J domain-containing protein n=1 Tax=Naematelia encephala TaxID=71784 RepID=A0A1Y2BF85_9TREE|nr:hypothetical protein BCR39DRAFT_463736 [Naematelia encephala]
MFTALYRPFRAGRSPINGLKRQSRCYSSTSQISPTRSCPSCSAVLPLSTSPCPQCADLLRIPSALSYHSILNLSQPIATSSSSTPTFDIPTELSTLPAHGYDINVRDLRQRMLQRQKELHPDKYGSKGEAAIELARELSGRVNEAYSVLSDPLKRAEYILSTYQLATDETDSLTDPMLLAEILEAREELDSATTKEEVDTIRAANHDRVETTIASIKEAFSEEPPNLAGAKLLSVQLKYWMGLEQAAKEWSPSIQL